MDYLVILCFGLIFLYLKVAHMSKSAMEFMDSAMIAPGLLLLNIYFRNIVNPYVMLLFCTVGKLQLVSFQQIFYDNKC